ncbi:MAG: FKBP-type peptidyl-prolyl cis-trans isomerase [Pedosphaera sp.]|nr:FKBP-type peptidyl-prolyl cis-trans isomerase [Pedosphaera sp.]
MKLAVSTLVAAGLLSAFLHAEDPALSNPEAAKLLKDTKDRVGYAYGLNIATMMKRQGAEMNADMLKRAIDDVAAGKTPLLNETEARQVMTSYQQDLRTKGEAKKKEQGQKNKIEGAKFLEENKGKEGVKTTASGLQYKVLKEGDGAMPKADDTVVTHYRGTLISGTEFDSSIKRGQPAEFPVNGVIKGWTEGLQLMKKGSKWQLFVPSEIAYAERGAGADIGPNATLIFEVELLDIKVKPASAAIQGGQGVVTSDIIKVPSAEELKKGAKIEVIKASDVEKLQKESEAAKGKK